MAAERAAGPPRASAPDGPAAAALDGAGALWVVHHDYSGFGRARAVPPRRFADVLANGVTFSRSAWDYLSSGQQVPSPGYAADSGDYQVVPDPDTIVRLPHVPGVAQAFADLAFEGRPWDGDPRGRLRHAVADLASLGCAARVAFESEFIVLREDAPGRWSPVEREPMFAVTALERQWDAWAGRLFGALEAAGIPVHQLTREGSPGQYELSLLPSDPLTAADRFLLARQIIKGCVPEPLVASFLPKPFGDLAGNGVHVHLSLAATSGQSVLDHPERPDALSDLGVALVSGLLDHAAGQCALGSPTPNSYLRLVPGTGAPARVSWGYGNRSTLVRVPGPGDARRIEHRAGDASANPYLMLLGIVATLVAALGAPRQPRPPQAVDLDHVTDVEASRLGASLLPRSLGEALDALERDQVLLAALGPTLAAHYLPYKRFEEVVRAAGVAERSGDALAWDREAFLRAT